MHLKQNKYLILLIALITSLSCNELRTDLSPLSIQTGNPFVISQMVELENGEIMCEGFDNAIATGAQDDVPVLRFYSKGLDLTHQVKDAFQTSVQDFQHITPYQDDAYLVIGVDTTQIVPRHHVSLRDRHLNILQETDLLGKYQYNSNEVLSALVLENGNISLILSNEKLLPDLSSEGVFIYHYLLDADLNTIVKTELFYADGVNSAQLDDQSILTVGSRDFFLFDSITGNFTFGKSFYSRHIREDGEIFGLDTIPLYYSHIEVAGMTNIGDQIVHHSISNDEHVLRYVFFNSDIGKFTNIYTLPTIYTNHVYRNFSSSFHFKFGSANPVSKGPNGLSGHFLYSNIDEKIIFFKVAGSGEVVPTFSLNLPPFDEILSYRQCFTRDGHIVAGVSYKYKDKLYFTLQTLDLEGNIIKESRAADE